MRCTWAASLGRLASPASVTEGCLSRYGGIFSFLLQLKLMMWAAQDVCFHLKRTG